MAQQHQRTAQPHGQRPPFTVRREPPRMSILSSAQVPDSSWADENFLLGAGMVVFQPATLKVVVVYEREKKYWFLPKGRKDVGESLEQTALREAYEESGYRVEFLPVYSNTRAPDPLHKVDAPNCEPIFINTAAYPARKRRNYSLPPGEYLSFWYIGQIPADAVREEGTGMPDEVNFETHLLDVDDALNKLFPEEARVLRYAQFLFDWTRKHLEEQRLKRLEEQHLKLDTSSSSDPV
ncbi:NUDIX hydrolase domain-like protein [Mycena vulgaris]|nr:NUDIX hydrolase domain-like protein [Mycena vulgaris]